MIIIFGRSQSVLGNGETKFFGPGQGTSSLDAEDVEVPMPPSTLANLRVRLSGIPTDDVVLTVAKNGVVTAITCTVSGGMAQECSSPMSEAFAEGDRVSLLAVTSGLASVHLKYSIELSTP